MTRRRSAWLAALVLALAAALPATADSDATLAQRLYLLQSDAGFKYWGVDPTDPELDSGPAVTSGTTGGLATTERFQQLTFAPASVFTATVPFDTEAPLRFHVEVDVFAAGPYTVRLALQKAGQELLSDPAVEVSPGVFDGTLSTKGRLGGGPLDMFVVRVTSMSPVQRVELRTGGASWIELPRPSAAYSVPQLIARSPRPATPMAYTSASRSITFNDDAWAVRTFTGTLDEVRTFPFEESRPAAAVIAWVDMADTPPLYEPLRGRTPEPRTMTDLPYIGLWRGSESLGSGERSAAALSVPAGQLSASVAGGVFSQGLPYTLHVLSVYGERTLQQMRWRFPMVPPVAAFTALGGTCTRYQALPTTSAVTTFVLDVDAASANPTSANNWTPIYELPGVGEFPCGYEGQRDEVRITAPGAARLYRIGAAPQRLNVPVVAVADTMLELEVRYAYTPIP